MCISPSPSLSLPPPSLSLSVCVCARVCAHVCVCDITLSPFLLFQVVHLLLKSGQCQPRPGALQTPLHIAAKHGQVECLRLLIQYGYAVDTKGMSGTCLHEASLYGKLDVVRFLLEVGADVSALNGQGLTPLEVVNQYTDPRSSQDLKKALQGKLAVCVLGVLVPLTCVCVVHHYALLAPHL